MPEQQFYSLPEILWGWDSNPGVLGEKREHYLCPIPSPSLYIAWDELIVHVMLLKVAEFRLNPNKVHQLYSKYSDSVSPFSLLHSVLYPCNVLTLMQSLSLFLSFYWTLSISFLAASLSPFSEKGCDTDTAELFNFNCSTSFRTTLTKLAK